MCNTQVKEEERKEERIIALSKGTDLLLGNFNIKMDRFIGEF
jgi:hypothetical protein